MIGFVSIASDSIINFQSMHLRKERYFATLSMQNVRVFFWRFGSSEKQHHIVEPRMKVGVND